MPGVSDPILLLQAPTGFGKTTLVRSWVSDGLGDHDGSETPVVWMPLSAEPTTVTAFWTGVVTRTRGLGLLDGAEAEAAIARLETRADPVPILVDLLHDRGPVVVVIDAYENLHDLTEEIDTTLLRVCELALDLRLIVTTRGPTSLADPEHRLRGRVSLLTEKDLAFTEAETRAFLRLADAEEAVVSSAGRIHRESRGYPLAVRAASLPGLRPSRPDGGHGWGELVARDLRARLAEDDLRRFAASTSIPPYFDRALAAELAGASVPPEAIDRMLGELEWHGYGRWIPYAPDAPAFQYVETFRDVMRADLEETDPEDYRRAAGVAARWLHRDRQHEQAFVLALRAEDYALASVVFLSVLLSTVESYTTDRLASELQPLSRETLHRYPLLAGARGVALFSNPATQASAGPYFVRIAEQSGVNWRGLEPPVSFCLRVAKSACLRYIGRYREAAAAARQALDYYRSVEIADEPTMVELRPMGLRQLGYSLFQAGDVESAARVIDEAIDTARVPWSRNYTAVYGVGFAAIEGRTRDSARLAELVDPDAWPRDHAVTFVNALGRVGAATRHLDAFDPRAALAEYDGCESFLDTAEFWPFVTWTRLHARLALGEAGGELHWVTDALRALPPPGIGDNLGTSMLRGLLALGWLTQGNLAETQEQLRRVTGWPGQVAPARLLTELVADKADRALHLLPTLEAEEGHTVRSTAALLTLGAAAAVRAGNDATAIALLNRATALYVGQGVRSHLLFVPAEDLASLRRLAGRCGPQTVEYLDVDVPGPLTGVGPAYPALTARELAVIEAYARCPRRADVAATLHVSPETVKSQLRSVYRKWEVNSRAGMLERAIELGALAPESHRTTFST